MAGVQRWQRRLRESLGYIDNGGPGNQGDPMARTLNSSILIRTLADPGTETCVTLIIDTSIRPQRGPQTLEMREQQLVESPLESPPLTRIQEWASRMEGVEYYHHDSDDDEYCYYYNRQEESQRQRWTRRQNHSRQGVSSRDGNGISTTDIPRIGHCW